jgi:K+-transporting ATPase ATPase C chain
LVTSSGSGLDPDISPLAANIQIRRIAEVRGLPENVIKKIVFEHTKRPLLGQPHIDVLELNIALDNETNYTPQKNE